MNQEEQKPKKRGRKPKPKTEEDTLKIPKKRGRKPKPKPPVDKTLPKKKRGRKKKCEMNLDAYQKIAGYNENGHSIDTKDNQIQFMEQSDIDDTEKECENFSFGGILNIQKINVQEEDHIELKKMYHQKTTDQKTEKRQEICEIDLKDIVDNDINISSNKENKKEQEKKNLCDFFGETMERQKKLKKKHSKDLYQRKYNKKKENNPEEIDTIKILHCYKGKEKELPKKTNVWCWWCCHPFDTIPRFIPTKYDQMRRRYKITGNFCGWPCAKAFMIHDTSYVVKRSTSMLTSLIREIHGRHYNIPSAPPRTVLQNFGGTMTIEEFRNIDNNEYFEINNHVMQLDNAFLVKRYRK